MKKIFSYGGLVEIGHEFFPVGCLSFRLMRFSPGDPDLVLSDSPYPPGGSVSSRFLWGPEMIYSGPHKCSFCSFFPAPVEMVPTPDKNVDIIDYFSEIRV